MKPRIAIPQPHSLKPDYNQRSLPQYIHAVEASGGEAITVSLEASPAEIARIASTCCAVLLPGSPADVDPQKYNEYVRHPKTADADVLRETADELLLQDAFNLRKPILGICYGLQSLNVWRTGTLRQHIESAVNHQAGRDVERAHRAVLEAQSMLHALAVETGAVANGSAALEINSSHHQSAEVPGDGLRVTARCPDDGVIEALESTDPRQFVLGVQWHPERGFDADPLSQRLFAVFVEAARKV